MSQLIKIHSLKLDMATKDDQHLNGYDHTRLSNVNTCPTWAAIRYGLHKRFGGAARSMALEAGSAAHEGFAAIRCFHLLHQTGNMEMFDYQLEQNFGKERAGIIKDGYRPEASDRTNIMNLASEALHSSGFYDDPSDRNRTLSNIETSLFARADRYDLKEKIWIRDENDPKSDVGIEIGFDIVVTIEYSYLNRPEETLTMQRRFIGKLDGLHINKQGKLVVCEDKTGARLDDSWLAQWIMSHQITGYCLAASVFARQPIHKARVTGMKIPVSKDIISTIRDETVNRNASMYTKWAEWFVHSVNLFEASTNDPLRAPTYTTSCNRYFNACSFLPICATEDEEEKMQIIEDMVLDEWSPLHE